MSNEMDMNIFGWLTLFAIASAALAIHFAYRCRVIKVSTLRPQRLARAVDTVGWDVLWLDAAGLVSDAYPSTLQSLACRREDLLGRTLQHAFPLDCTDALNKLFQPPFTPGAIRNTSFEFESLDGRASRIEILLADAGAVDGGIGGLIAFVRQTACGRDENASAHVPAAGGKSDEQALQLARRGMNAELHNMLGLLQLSLDGVPEGLHKDYLKEAIRSATGLRGLLERMTEYSDALKTSPTAIATASLERLDDVGMRMTEKLQQLAGRKPILVNWASCGNQGSDASCNGSRLSAVLERAGAWAIAQMAAGHLDIAYTTQPALRTGGLRVHLTLTIFGRHPSARPIISPRREGEGGPSPSVDSFLVDGIAALDWALACRMAELIGGIVYAKDEGARGYVVNILFEAPGTTASSQELVPEEVWQLPHTHWGAKALVVEDNAVTRYMTREVLSRMGMTVLEAGRAIDALRMLRAEPVDIVLMDVHMPDMDGAEATRLIRDDPLRGEVPIIAITGDESAEIEMLCRQAGADEVVRKPLRTDELRVLISRYLVNRNHPPLPPARPLCESNAAALMGAHG